MCSKFIGIDNGVSGFMAVIEGNKIVDYKRCPRENPCEILDFLEKHKDVTLVAIESGLITHKFRGVTGTAFEWQGRYKMCLDIKGIPYIMADPRVSGWRKKLGFKSNKREDYKEESITLCMRYFENAEDELTFPCRKRVDGHLVDDEYIDDNLADSCMLAKYAELMEGAKK